MTLDLSQNSLIIKGNIKSVNDYQMIKTTLDRVCKTEKELTLHIVDSISIISSIIGYLNKIVLKDGIKLTIKVGNAQLFELFDDLNLVKLFNVQKN